jgi:hypothetical protein
MPEAERRQVATQLKWRKAARLRRIPGRLVTEQERRRAATRLKHQTAKHNRATKKR